MCIVGGTVGEYKWFLFGGNIVELDRLCPLGCDKC